MHLVKASRIAVCLIFFSRFFFDQILSMSIDVFTCKQQWHVPIVLPPGIAQKSVMLAGYMCNTRKRKDGSNSMIFPEHTFLSPNPTKMSSPSLRLILCCLDTV